MISFFEDYNTDLIVIIMFDKVLSLRRGGYAHELFFGNKMEKLRTLKMTRETLEIRSDKRRKRRKRGKRKKRRKR